MGEVKLETIEIDLCLHGVNSMVMEWKIYLTSYLISKTSLKFSEPHLAPKFSFLHFLALHLYSIKNRNILFVTSMSRTQMKYSGRILI